MIYKYILIDCQARGSGRSRSGGTGNTSAAPADDSSPSPTGRALRERSVSDGLRHTAHREGIEYDASREENHLLASRLSPRALLDSRVAALTSADIDRPSSRSSADQRATGDDHCGAEARARLQPLAPSEERVVGLVRYACVVAPHADCRESVAFLTRSARFSIGMGRGRCRRASALPVSMRPRAVGFRTDSRGRQQCVIVEEAGRRLTSKLSGQAAASICEHIRVRAWQRVRCSALLGRCCRRNLGDACAPPTKVYARLDGY